MSLKQQYSSKVIPTLMGQFKYKSPMQVPRLSKIVLNLSIAESTQNAKVLDVAAQELTMIAGQKPVIRRAKKSISNFKLRQGMPIVASVTLRHARMYDFLERFIHVVLPRVRDFQGVKASAIDHAGNLTIGIKEHIVFPEISNEDIRHILGLEVTIVTTARNKNEARSLFKALGFPLV